MTAHAAPRPFTGRRLALMIFGMFAVIIAVNVTMATLAVRTFSGAVVGNGYVANQQFNGWIARGEAEAALGWTARIETADSHPVVIVRDRSGRPLEGAKLRLRLRHPLRADEIAWQPLVETSPGRYIAAAPVARGQWDAVIVIEHDGRTVHARDRLYVSAGR